jgi:hypothetical protein
LQNKKSLNIPHFPQVLTEVYRNGSAHLLVDVYKNGRRVPVVEMQGKGDTGLGRSCNDWEEGIGRKLCGFSETLEKADQHF